jgi:hypothetical protein
MNSKKITTRH